MHQRPYFNGIQAGLYRPGIEFHIGYFVGMQVHIRSTY